MNHKDITEMIQTMKVKPLTAESVGEFFQNANGLFVPNATYQRFRKIGCNEVTKSFHDFSKDKPLFEFDESSDNVWMDQGGYVKDGVQHLYLQIYFKERTLPDFLTVVPRSVPMQFGFVPGKALYTAESQYSGTPEFPDELFYLKL